MYDQYVSDYGITPYATSYGGGAPSGSGMGVGNNNANALAQQEAEIAEEERKRREEEERLAQLEAAKQANMAAYGSIGSYGNQLQYPVPLMSRVLNPWG